MKAREIYSLELEEQTGDSILARVYFHADHPVYGGHFPGMPLTPGVCQLALVREAMEASTGKALRLLSAKNLKFTHMHDPSKEGSLVLELSPKEDGDAWRVDAVLRGAEVVYFKCKVKFAEA